VLRARGIGGLGWVLPTGYEFPTYLRIYFLRGVSERASTLLRRFPFLVALVAAVGALCSIHEGSNRQLQLPKHPNPH